MAIAPRNQTRRQGDVNLLVPPPRPPIRGIGSCLVQLQRQWSGDGNLAALWQAWPRIAGPQLAPHCQPLQLRGGRLLVGASHPQWLQALRFNKHQLLGALRGAGFAVADLQFQQHQPMPLPAGGSELEAQAWAHHPSRVDVHGMTSCPQCGRPAPGGELRRWGHCSFCARTRMDTGVAMGTASSTELEPPSSQ
jgi:hypothetical protein